MSEKDKPYTLILKKKMNIIKGLVIAGVILVCVYITISLYKLRK